MHKCDSMLVGAICTCYHHHPFSRPIKHYGRQKQKKKTKLNRHDLPETAYTASLKDESRPILEALAGPAHGESPKDVSMRHDEHVTGWLGLLGVGCSLFHHRRVVLVTDVGYEAIKPGGYVLGASF